MATIRKLRGRWQAQVRRRGVAPRAKSFNTKADAQRWAQDLEAEANRSGWVADTRLAEKTTLRELLTRYCAEVTPGKRGAVSEASRINSILRCPMSHRTLAKLTSADVATYRDERLKSVAPATVVRELNTVSHAIEIATREWGLWLPRNPVKLVRRPQVPRGRTRRLKAGEEARLLAACDSGRTPLMKPLIILAIETAMRRRAVAILKGLKADKGGDAERVFPATGNSIRLAFEHLRVRAEMDDFHFHDLRHEAVSRLFEKGLNIAEVSAISGHKELKMLQRYTHLRAEDLVSRLG